MVGNDLAGSLSLSLPLSAIRFMLTLNFVFEKQKAPNIKCN